MSERHAFCGYLVTVDLDRDPSFGSGLPEKLPSAGGCLNGVVSAEWACSGSGLPDASRSEPAKRFALDADRYARLAATVDALLAARSMRWPAWLMTTDAVRAVLAVLQGSSAPRVLGLGVYRESIPTLEEAFADEIARWNDPADSLLASIREVRAMPEGGTVLGYEPLSLETGAIIAHSWHCNGLANVFEARMQGIPNPFGLIDDFTLARDFTALLTREQLGEPGVWIPFLLVDYTERFGRAAV